MIEREPCVYVAALPLAGSSLTLAVGDPFPVQDKHAIRGFGRAYGIPDADTLPWEDLPFVAAIPRRDLGPGDLARVVRGVVAIVALVMLFGLPGRAHALGDVGGVEVRSGGTLTSSECSLDFDSTDFAITKSGSRCLPALKARTFERVGGDGSDGAFSYAGQVASCPAACTGGCAGSEGSGTCTLAANAPLVTFANGLGLTGNTAVVKNYTTFTLSAGTVTTDGSSVLAILLSNSPAITGGTITVKGFGAGGSGTGTITCSTAGRAGANTNLVGGGSGGSNAGGNGTNGTAALLAQRVVWPLWGGRFIWAVGGGGGNYPGSGVTGSQPLAAWGTNWGGAGGNGGGTLHIEFPGTWTCSGATLTAAGNDGTLGAAGGGGGLVHVLATAYGSDSCTYSAAGGSQAGTKPTNCGTSGNGGAGVVLKDAVPM